MRYFFPIRSIVLRVALKVAGLTALIGIILFSLIYKELAEQGHKQLVHEIDTDIAGLIDIYSGQGKDALILRINERLDVASLLTDQPYYYLADDKNSPLAGNLSALPSVNLAASPLVTHKLPNLSQKIVVRKTRLSDGLILGVGRAKTRLDHGLDRVKWLFGSALVGMILASFGLGAYTSMGLRRRIEGLNNLFDELIDPSASQKKLPTNGDEIDGLKRNIKNATSRIKSLLLAQRDLNDNIAHEMRTPLITLENRLQKAIEQAHIAELLTPLHEASAQTRVLLQLLDALLDIASAEAQRGDLSGVSDINLSEVARSILELYAASAEEAGIELICDIEDGVMMRADAMQISRLLVNLLDNAFKYGIGGAFIRLKIAHGPLIMVEDDGPGIAQAEREMIFERYKRGAARNHKGHGLGLALVKAIAQRYGLHIVLDQDRQKGASFIISRDVSS